MPLPDYKYSVFCTLVYLIFVSCPFEQAVQREKQSLEAEKAGSMTLTE